MDDVTIKWSQNAVIVFEAWGPREGESAGVMIVEEGEDEFQMVRDRPCLIWDNGEEEGSNGACRFPWDQRMINSFLVNNMANIIINERRASKGDANDGRT